MPESWEHVAILGAGLAGLGSALELPGARIYEAQDHPGGHVYSHVQNGVAFDEGAHISHTKNQGFLRLIYGAAGDVCQIEPSTVRNFWHESWTGYPIQNHLRDLPEELRIRALTDLVLANAQAPDSDEPTSYREWCLRQYGGTLTDEFYEVFTRKYWRRNAAEMSTDWLGGRLIPTDLANIIAGAFHSDVRPQASFTRFHYPRHGGFYSFFKPLYDQLHLALGHRVVEIDLRTRTLSFESGATESFEQLLTSIPLPDLVAAIKDAPHSVAEAASKLRHTKLLCVNVIVSRPSLTDMHWCYVYDEDIEPSRLSFPSNLAPGSASEGTSAIQAEVFRDSHESWNRDILVDRTVSQVATLLGFDSKKDVLGVNSKVVTHAYIVSDHDRANAASHIIEWLEAQDVHSMGLYGRWQYVWSDVAFASGVSTGRKLVEGLKQWSR